MSRVLYSGTRNASSWALRAWLALREQNIPFEERVVDIRRPQRFENLASIAQFSPPGAVPVLVDGDVVIFDSLAIMEYASELGKEPLLPADIRLRALADGLGTFRPLRHMREHFVRELFLSATQGHDGNGSCRSRSHFRGVGT